VEDWAENRRLYRSEKLSQAAIARRLALSRNTVAKALQSESPPRYERKPVLTSAWAQIEGCSLFDRSRHTASVTAAGTPTMSSPAVGVTCGSACSRCTVYRR
jgi:hypothetical protein